MERTVYLALGANLGDRRANLEEAIRRLTDAGVVVARRSEVHETEPQYVLDQPKFLNMAVEAATALSPWELLAVIKRTEKEMGRVKVVDKGPRIIDIDILLYEGMLLEEPRLTIPHPRMSEREFVLVPLAELGIDGRKRR